MEFWQRHRVLPLEEDEQRMSVGVHSGTARDVLEDIRLTLRKDVRPVLMSLEEVEDGLRRLVVEQQRFGKEEEEISADIPEGSSQDLLTDTAGAPIVRLVNALFLEAMRTGASDIHIEPYEDETLIRMRVDGVLHELHRVPRSRHPQVAARLKVMSRLDLAETRRPQDGRLHVHSGERHVDVRISTVPTLHGERVVMRLLEKDMKLYTLEQVGMLADVEELINDLISRPYGLLLVTGPTGSGKTTTLYSVLQKLRSPTSNLITIEDPVEYQLPGVGQIQVNEKIGLTFASGLRSILRQDPDVLMIGEIRDPETADIAIHAALTGHMVLSTLHTNDAPAAATRLLDLGVAPYLLSSVLVGVLAQRLVRRLCVHCKQPYRPDSIELRKIGLERASGEFYRPAGCPACLNTGYRGRTGIFELMTVDEDMASRIARSEDSRALRHEASQKGMRSLMEDAAQKVMQGHISTDEAIRVTRAQF
ncbi:MAG: type II/IV secretion system protein [Armatimonadetes bacterium]|nr:type II/IV secretion system protein [Armatimonadota bacterium]